MKLLEEKILNTGKCIGDDILKVDMFLNHQLDVKLLDDIGEEINRIFAEDKPNKILTVEASGIAIAVAASRAMGYLPVVFAKKTKPSTMIDDSYCAEAISFTKGTSSILRVSKDFLNKDDRVLIIDDFLAKGEAGMALCDLVKQAGGTVVGFTAAIEKEHQGGAERMRNIGIKVQSLAVIAEMRDGKITFK
ncbi:MAG: xanthine phosphoribosyltransferase [Bacillota bacterium]|nr:xanthine phosphoribosyltransferase [Bacillota bacterium]